MHAVPSPVGCDSVVVRVLCMLMVLAATVCVASIFNGTSTTVVARITESACARWTPAGTMTQIYEPVVPDFSSRKEPILPDVAQHVLSLERQGKGRKLIAMSLYGADARYTQNAIYNAMRARDDWPGWTLRVYYGKNSVPKQVVELIAALGAETVAATDLRPDTSTFWRFFALEDRTVTRVIFRDADALLSVRDRAAVQEWMATEWPVHIMHDHQDHQATVLAGMWGVVTGYVNPVILKKFRTPANQSVAAETAQYGADQAWLHNELWPLVRNATINHASFHCKRFGEAEWRPFPTLMSDNKSFVGQVYSAKSMYRGDHTAALCPEKCRQAGAARC